MRPSADLATGLLAAGRAEDDDAIGTQLVDVAPGRRLGPHLPVHGRCHQQRASPAPAGRVEEQVIGKADQVNSSAMESGGGGGYDQRIHSPRQRYMVHAAALAMPGSSWTGLPDSAWKVAGPSEGLGGRGRRHNVDAVGRA
jgi:hypothetical protein